MAEISLSRIKREIIVVEVRGTAPLIVKNWSTKAKTEMLQKQMGKKVPKSPKVPEDDFRDSKYIFADGSGEGFPVTAFKAATVKGGARAFGKAVKMTELRQTLFFQHEGFDTLAGLPLVHILSEEPASMREDMVRVGMGTADIRFRAQYDDWRALLTVSFMPQIIDEESVVALIDAGGSNGVGEWRPERSGVFGTYEVVSA